MTKVELIESVIRLKNEKNALVLAHYYQDESIQQCADYVGDSYGLSLKAKNSTAEMIVFAGVHFMAETAKILNPSKKIIVPDLETGCSLAASCEYDRFKKMKEMHPNHVVVTYINCSAEIKSLSDVICTSSNAEKIINSIPINKDILFAPDKNLGKYLEKKTGRRMLLWNGVCIVHESFSFNKLLEIINANPGIKIVAHPESNADILELANFIGSTTEMINYVVESKDEKFIIATEIGIIHELKKKVPTKILIPAPSYEENSCACSECAYMKVNTLKKLYDCLVNESPEIYVSAELIDSARKPIDKMIKITENEI